MIMQYQFYVANWLSLAWLAVPQQVVTISIIFQTFKIQKARSGNITSGYESAHQKRTENEIICGVIKDCILMRDEKSCIFTYRELQYIIKKLCTEWRICK